MAEYRTSIEIEADPDTVFDYLTTEAGMTAWMGQSAALDPRPGGGFAVDIAGFAEGERVALFYYPQTAATSTAPAAECFTVRHGAIVESVLVFDRLSFGPPAAS